METEQAQLCKSKAFFFKAMGYHPHAAQYAVHSSMERFLICAGGARLGKSLLGGAEGAYEFFYPDRHIWYVASQYDLAQKEFDWSISLLNNYKINGRPITDFCKITTAEKGSKVIKSPWGSWIRTRSTEKPASLLGEELDLVVLCEASQLPKSAYERYIRERLGPRNGRLIACSTPNADGGLFWYLYQKAEFEKNWKRWLFPTIANPTFSKQEYEVARKELDSKVFAEQYEGKFVSRRGHVFSVSDANILDNQYIVNESWPIMAGIYYKSNNPCGVVFIAVNPAEREYIVYDEICSEKAPIEIFPLIQEKIKGKRFLGVYCDYWDAAIQKELRSCFSVGMNRQEKDIGKIPAYIKRVYAVQNALKTQDDGKTRLKILRKCSALIDNLEKAKWPDRRKEEEEKEEQQLPLTKFMTMPLALSFPLAFAEIARGNPIYGNV